MDWDQPNFNQMTIGEIAEGHSYFILHFDETVTAQVKKQVDLLVQNCSEVDNGIKIKYLTSIIVVHAKTQDMVTEVLKALEKLTIPLKWILSLGMDGPNVNKSIQNKSHQIKRRKAIDSQLATKLSDSCLPQ